MNVSFWNYRGLLGILLIAVGFMSLPGCEKDQPVLDDPTAMTLASLRYPGKSQYGPDLDIVVVRSASAIRLTNRTARSYGGMQLWLNQQYVQQTGPITIGSNSDIHLATLVNRHREPFPVGTFLQPDLGRPVITAELYDPVGDVRYRLTVQPDKEAIQL